MLLALHVPDHTLTTELTVAATIVAAIGAASAWRLRSANVTRPSLPLFVGVTALVFGVQMINFPLLDGATSGHVLGAAAAVLLLGPVAGVVAMMLVIASQALLLGDGGTTALGANLLNMAIVAPLTAWYTAEFVRRRRTDAVGTLIAAGTAGWVSTVAAASLCAVQLALSGVGSLGANLATLVGHHALLGVAEAALTVAVVAPWVVPAWTVRRGLQWGSLAVAAALAFALVPASSELPDTLEVVLAAHTDAATTR